MELTELEYEQIISYISKIQGWARDICLASRKRQGDNVTEDI